MLNANKLLERANSYFVNKDYSQALFIYSQLCSEFPSNKEYPMYALFCDIGSEDSEKAQSLFDYFEVSKDEGLESAIKSANDIINAYDGDVDKMMKLMKDVSDQAHETLEAINYDDFMMLVRDRGSFRVAYEDIMFSTKVAITSKEQFFDFVEKLIQNSFYSTAYKYLDGYNDFFTYDSKLKEFYTILEGKQSDNINK